MTNRPCNGRLAQLQVIRSLVVWALALVPLAPAFAAAPFHPFQPVQMGAELLKPYTEFEFQGKIYTLQQLRGGHNAPTPNVVTPVVQRCRTNPPVFDPVANVWRIPVTNSLIHFSTDESPFGRLRLSALDGQVDGYLEFIQPAATPAELDFPVRSVFQFRVLLELPDFGLTLTSVNPVTIRSENLMAWPPPVGTVYLQTEEVDFAAVEGGPVVATLKPDQTVITALVP